MPVSLRTKASAVVVVSAVKNHLQPPAISPSHKCDTIRPIRWAQHGLEAEEERVKFKPILGSDLSGHIGGVVASHNTYGPYFRQRVRPVNRKTAAQNAQRGAIAAVSQTWRSLDPTVRSAWTAATIVKTSRKGDRVNLSGQAAFMFVNTIRWRAGLALVTNPPTSTAVPSLTTPTETFTSATTVNLDVALTDEWNASGGSLIISGRLLTSPGQSYGSPNVAVALVTGPQTSPIALTLPFAVPLYGRARLTLHAGSPDGRQSTYVDVEAVQNAYTPPPPGSLRVVSVTVISSTEALWQFNGPTGSVTGADTHLQIGSGLPTGTASAGLDQLIATYAGPITAGNAWQITGQPSSIANPVLYPQSGTTLG